MCVFLSSQKRLLCCVVLGSKKKRGTLYGQWICILERTTTHTKRLRTSSLFQKVSRVSNAPKTVGGVCVVFVPRLGRTLTTSSRRWDVYVLLLCVLLLLLVTTGRS